MQAIIGFIKPGDIIHVRRANQSSVECVGPCVIRTLNCGGMAALIFPEPRSAMTANVVKGADRRSLIFHDDQAFAGYVRKEIVAGFSELALMAHQYPIGREYLLQLFSKNLR